MKRKKRRQASSETAETRQGSLGTVLEKAVETGSSLPIHPIRAWQSAKEGTQELASALPELKGVNQVKEFIRRHPTASTCAALVVGYMVFESALPFLGRAFRFVRS